jgi:hypothetical protein
VSDKRAAPPAALSYFLVSLDPLELPELELSLGAVVLDPLVLPLTPVAEPEPVAVSATPASRARGKVSPRRPCAVLSAGVWPELVLVPRFSVQAAPAIRAAADANVIHLRRVIVGVLSRQVTSEAGRRVPRLQARSARESAGHAGTAPPAVH